MPGLTVFSFMNSSGLSLSKVSLTQPRVSPCSSLLPPVSLSASSPCLPAAPPPHRTPVSPSSPARTQHSSHCSLPAGSP